MTRMRNQATQKKSAGIKKKFLEQLNNAIFTNIKQLWCY